MSRVGLSVVVAAVVGVSLTGCSSALSSNSVGTTPGAKVRIRPAGRRDPHHPRPDMQDALRTDGAVARAAGHHRQERLLAANRPSHPGSAAGSPVLGESAADSRTQSGPRRA